MAVDKKLLFLRDTDTPLAYKKAKSNIKKNIPIRENANRHGDYLKRRFDEAIQQSLTQRQVAAIRYKDGTYLEISGKSGYELTTKCLENRTAGFKLQNVREDNGVTKAVVYIPGGKETSFLKKIEEYSTEKTKTGKPKNNDMISSIEDIKLAMVDAFWFDKPEKMPIDTKQRCEIWLSYTIKKKGDEITSDLNEVDAEFTSLCEENGIALNSKILVFPERFVKMAECDQKDLVTLLTGCGNITEFKLAVEPNTFFTELSISEQKEWVDELKERIHFDFSEQSSFICLLDSGINYTHPLISPATKEELVQSYNPDWGVEDNFYTTRGHGTEMIGIALYHDLKECMLSEDEIIVEHQIESVKILPPRGENPRDLYGLITEDSILLAEVANPNKNRVIVMPITSSDQTDETGKPSSWSAAIDSICYGNNSDYKRLMILSAGNIEPNENNDFPNSNLIHSVMNPAQSWNAITVGAYTKNVDIEDPSFNGFNALAETDGISPYSTTSNLWERKWPIKPEVLFEGGNMATNGQDIDCCDDLSLLTTGYRPQSLGYFSTIWGTSAAAAQASYFCAHLYNEYPNLWPETVRALMIHSAEWTDTMKRQFCPDERRKSDRINLLRSCGYGIPDLNRAIQCFSNSVNMIIQDELQPYSKNTVNEMKLHELPWPRDLLESLGEVDIKLKVTLSYYIEPSPGEVGWKDKYRYQSCGLRFELINDDQTKDDFVKRINLAMRGDDEADIGAGSKGTERWYLGPKNRDTGSIISDYMIQSAVNLCDCNYLAVYPIGGWWKDRPHLGKSYNRIRYSLVVSLSTPSIETDLYTPIVQAIETQNAVAIEI